MKLAINTSRLAARPCVGVAPVRRCVPVLPGRRANLQIVRAEDWDESAMDDCKGIVRDYCYIDPETGKRKEKPTLGELEQEFLEALTAYYYEVSVGTDWPRWGWSVWHTRPQPLARAQSTGVRVFANYACLCCTSTTCYCASVGCHAFISAICSYLATWRGVEAPVSYLTLSPAYPRLARTALKCRSLCLWLRFPRRRASPRCPTRSSRS